MKITEKLLILGKPARSGKKFMVKLDSIIIHWIGPYPGQSVSDPWNCWENENPVTKKLDGTGKQASAHFIIKNKDVIQSLPLDEVGWHSGDSRNYGSIGIEVIPMNIAGEFSAATIETLRELVQHIRTETGLPLPLERHFDGIQKKDCPRFYTPCSEVITKDKNGEKQGGDQRWKELETYLNGGTNE
jgi:hypothetical protein